MQHVQESASTRYMHSRRTSHLQQVVIQDVLEHGTGDDTPCDTERQPTSTIPAPLVVDTHGLQESARVVLRLVHKVVRSCACPTHGFPHALNLLRDCASPLGLRVPKIEQGTGALVS